MNLSEENDLLTHWFVDIGTKQDMYKEPLLDAAAVEFFKQICDAFEQNTHVFILSVEVAENYIRAKDSNLQKINDPVLAAVTITFICHKCEGALESLKIKHVIDILYYFTQKVYNAGEITAMEGDILVTLNGKLPVTTPLDDLDIIIEKYIRENRFRADVRPLCLKILEFVYIERMTWFEALKVVYGQNKDCVAVFQDLISSKLYVPVSVFVAAMKLTHYQYVLDIDTILADVTKHTKIHQDHLSILAAKIIEIVT